MTAPIATKDAVLDDIYNLKLEPNKTFPKGVDGHELFGPLGSGDALNIAAILVAAMSAGAQGAGEDIVVNLVGAPGTGKTSIVNFIAKSLGADVVFFGPNAAPDSAIIPGIGKMTVNGEEVEYIDYILEEKLASDRPKIIIFDELSRMTESMRQQALEVLGPKPRLAGHDLKNVVGRVVTGNRVDDGVDALDPALTTRVVTVPVRASAMPWKFFVAAEFSNHDLSGVFKAHDALEPSVREQVSPRKVRKLVWNLIHNGSAWPGLAMIDGEYEKFLDRNERDVTAEVVDAFAAALGTPNTKKLSDPLDRAIKAVIEHGQGVYVEGPPGIGKTSEIEARIKDARPDAKVLTISMATASPEDFSLVMIKDGKLKRQLNRFFEEEGEKYLIADEVFRAPDDVMDCLLEIFQERTVAGRPTNIRGFFALNNPRNLDGYQLDVGEPDSAQADRFTMSISVTAQDMGFRGYLIKKYGEVAEHFIEWWDGLSAQNQALYNVRVLETAIKWYQLGLPLEMTKPYYDGLQLDISLLELERRLADRPMVRIKEVIANIDHYIAELSAPGGQNSEAHRAVYDAFDRADLVQLEPVKKDVVRLINLLSQQAKINLLRDKGERRKFWREVVQAAAKQTAKK